MQGIAIGESNFKSLRQRDCYFIDKSLYIKDIIDNQSSVILIRRPRRFGKTLNMSMLKYYFDCTQENSKELFKRFKNNGTRRKIYVKNGSISMYIYDIKRCSRYKL